MNSFDLSVIIVNYNAQKFLGTCLSALQKTTKRISYEVILVDNNSNDDSVKYVQTYFPDVKIIPNKENVGFAAANNQGIQKAQGTFILLLNPDTIVPDYSISKLIGFALNNPHIGILGCRVVNPGNGLQWDSCGNFLTPATLCFRLMGFEKIFPRSKIFGKRLLDNWPRNTSRQIDWVSGVCMLIRKRLIEEVGSLDERFFAYYEDMDYCRRAVMMKWPTFFLHDAHIFHFLSTSWRKKAEHQLLTSLRSEKLYIRKYYGHLGVLSFKIVYLCSSSIRLFTHMVSHNKYKARNHYRILRWIIRNEIS